MTRPRPEPQLTEDVRKEVELRGHKLVFDELVAGRPYNARWRCARPDCDSGELVQFHGGRCVGPALERPCGPRRAVRRRT